MESLTNDMYIIPIITLTLVIGLYFYFLGKVNDVIVYRNRVLTMVLFSVMFNFLWEMAHAPLYIGFKYDIRHVAVLALASFADMFLVLLLFFIFGVLYKKVFWIIHMKIWRVLLLILVGGTGAVLGELWHTARGDWYYNETMPKLLCIDVGIAPVLQFALLPLLIFWATIKSTTVKI